MDLRGCQQLIVGRSKDKLRQSTAKIGPVDALTRQGEQHLFDQMANVIIITLISSATATVDSKRKPNLHYLHPLHPNLGG